MNISINRISAYSKLPLNTKKQCNNTNNTTFQGIGTNKVMRYLSYSASSLAMLAALSCLGSKTKSQGKDNADSVNINTEISSRTNNAEKNENDSIETKYYYTAIDGEITGENYSWVEKTYPDGKIEKDSMGYKIIETPAGERTISTVRRNEKGESIITTNFPDGSREIRIEDGINYKDTIFWANGNIKQIKNKEVLIDQGQLESPCDDEELVVNLTYKAYDENGVLLYWNVVDSNETLDENDYKYDKKDRLIDNGFTKYEYKGDSNIPFRTTDELEGCKYITEMNEEGIETKRYFKASNGVITPASELYSISW